MDRITLSDLDVWVFQRNDDGDWVWQRLSPDREVLLQSPAGFRTMEDCTRDATRHGYTGSL
jgi:hypothetical protein